MLLISVSSKSASGSISAMAYLQYANHTGIAAYVYIEIYIYGIKESIRLLYFSRMRLCFVQYSEVSARFTLQFPHIHLYIAFYICVFPYSLFNGLYHMFRGIYVHTQIVLYRSLKQLNDMFAWLVWHLIANPVKPKLYCIYVTTTNHTNWFNFYMK